MCVFFFTGVQFSLGVLKGARQLPFTAPGGNKQRGRGRYLALLLEQEAKEETLLGSHCNYTQLQGKKRIKEEILLKSGFIITKFLPQESIHFWFLLVVCVRAHSLDVIHLFLPAPSPFPGPLTACWLLSTSAVNQLYPVIQLAFPATGDVPADLHADHLMIC